MAEHFPRPELLAHPNLPGPLHGLNPRTILGPTWWNVQRIAAYERYGNRCWACGTPREEAEYTHFLEGHESYAIDYAKGTARLSEVVALCHACHAFIHSGRLWSLYAKGEVSREDALHILERGISILRQAGFQPFYAAYMFKSMMHGNSEIEAADFSKEQGGWYPPKSSVLWGDWRLVIDGKRYKPVFEDERAWQEYYANEQYQYGGPLVAMLDSSEIEKGD